MLLLQHSHNDIPQVAQRNVFIVAHSRHRSPSLCCCISVLVTTFPECLSGTGPYPAPCICPERILFCVHMYIFADSIRRMPPPMFDDTAITDRHSDTTFSTLGMDFLFYWIGKVVRTCAAGRSPTLDFLCIPFLLSQALR